MWKVCGGGRFEHSPEVSVEFNGWRDLKVEELQEQSQSSWKYNVLMTDIVNLKCPNGDVAVGMEPETF